MSPLNKDHPNAKVQGTIYNISIDENNADKWHSNKKVSQY